MLSGQLGPARRAGQNQPAGVLNAAQLDRCLKHLEAAEQLMLEAGDLADLARLSLVIELLRRGHGLADRPIDMAEFMRPLQGQPCGA